jgi:ABC-type glycerol-3-phosphate transport system substrate-binding protein
MGIVSLDELAHLRDGRKRVTGFAVAPLPGSEAYLDPQTGKLVPSPDNYVPHHAGGWLGVVRTSCKHPDAAWDLLAELGGPARSLEIIAAGGYGPTRDTHLDRDRLVAWFGYGLDDEQSKALQDSLRTNVAKAVRNPTFGLRGPEHPELTAALAGELSQLIAGKIPADRAMSQAAAAWRKIAASVPPDQWKLWRRHSVGLN